MKKVILKAPGEIVLTDAPEPVLNDNEALIEVASSGLCGADISSYLGKTQNVIPLPIVPGHEFGGIVKEIKGKTDRIKVGDKVAVFPLFNCGKCYYCSRGWETDCGGGDDYGYNYYGSPAIEGACVERMAVPLEKCVKMDDDFDMRYSAIIEPLAVALHAVGEITDSIILISGVGSIGILMLEVAKLNNNKVIAVDADEYNLRMATKLGADLAVNFNDANKNEKIEALLKDDKVEVAALTFVNQSVFDWILDIIRKHGLIISIAECEDVIDFKFVDHVWKALTLRGSVALSQKEFEQAAQMVQQHKIHYEDIVTKFYPLSQAAEAFEHRAKNNELKVVLLP